MPLDISNLSVKASLTHSSGSSSSRSGKESEEKRHQKVLQQMQRLLESMAPMIRENMYDRINR